ncbi:MAG: S-layer homology domain-containing protein [Clostridia bacterium]|nr:S-layer homology domain-containing protein [Clostridia bacterium]
MKKFKTYFNCIFCILMCASMIASVSPWHLSDDEYWPAHDAYNAAVASGDEDAILAAVKLIEAAYPSPSNESEYLRLFFPSLEAAKIHERRGEFPNAAIYYKKCYELAELLNGEGNSYLDYLNTVEMLYRHNSVVPTVYAQTSDKANIPYYGTRAEPEAGCLHGMTDHFDKNFDNAQILYVQFFDEDIEPFYWQLPTDTEDYTLMIGWNVPNENYEDLFKIANGEADDYIRRNLEYLATLKCRVLIRFGAEVNCWSSLPSSLSAVEEDGGRFAEKFKEAFRRISLMARDYCPSAGMIYSPNDISNWYFDHEDFYPGDEYVDWVGMSAYNNLTSKTEFKAGDGNDAYYSIGDYYDNQIVKIESIVESYGDRKPIIITEGGIAHRSDDGLQTEQHALEGMRFFYTYVNRVYPQVKCVMYFNSNYSSNKYSIFGLHESNTAVAELYRTLNADNAAMEYSMGRGDACGYVPLESFCETCEDLKLSVYAAFPTAEEIKVTYELNGKNVFESTEYPYSYNIDINSLSVGGHLLRVYVSCLNTNISLDYKLTLSPDGTVKVTDPIPDTISDVPESFWGYDAVMFGMAKDIFNGTSETTFEPKAGVTRAMFVTILARMSGADPKKYTNTSFDDVALGKWYSPYVEWARSYGIVNGKSNTEFAPNDMITREQMCAILVRYCSIFNIELGADGDIDEASRFADDELISTYARDYVYTAKNCGLVGGKNGNLFDPKAGATRAEAATIFMRFIIGFVNE